jgi:hypothetical protein
MAEPSLGDQMASLSSTLRVIEVRMALGRLSLEELEDFRSILDDMRVRLWSLLCATGRDDYPGFQERFRIRRATELCRRLSSELRGGSVSGRDPDLPRLKEAALELKQTIEQARTRGA